jgi:hypothetical protein
MPKNKFSVASEEYLICNDSLYMNSKSTKKMLPRKTFSLPLYSSLAVTLPLVVLSVEESVDEPFVCCVTRVLLGVLVRVLVVIGSSNSASSYESSLSDFPLGTY